MLQAKETACVKTPESVCGGEGLWVWATKGTGMARMRGGWLEMKLPRKVSQIQTHGVLTSFPSSLRTVGSYWRALPREMTCFKTAELTKLSPRRLKFCSCFTCRSLAWEGHLSLIKGHHGQVVPKASLVSQRFVTRNSRGFFEKGGFNCNLASATGSCPQEIRPKQTDGQGSQTHVWKEPR